MMNFTVGTHIRAQWADVIHPAETIGKPPTLFVDGIELVLGEVVSTSPLPISAPLDNIRASVYVGFRPISFEASEVEDPVPWQSCPTQGGKKIRDIKSLGCWCEEIHYVPWFSCAADSSLFRTDADTNANAWTPVKRQFRHSPYLDRIKTYDEKRTIPKDEFFKPTPGAYPLLKDYTPEEGQAPNLTISLLEGQRPGDETGWHAPAIDIDHGCKLIPSQTPGHYHLYIHKAIRWHKYRALLIALAEAGLVEHGYVQASLARGYTSLRAPGPDIIRYNFQRIMEANPDLSIEDIDITDMLGVGQDEPGSPLKLRRCFNVLG